MGVTFLTSGFLGTVLGSSDQNPKERMFCVPLSASHVGLPDQRSEYLLITCYLSLADMDGAGITENKIYFRPKNFLHFLNFPHFLNDHMWF